MRRLACGLVALGAMLAVPATTLAQGAGAEIKERHYPKKVDVFDLSFEGVRHFSRMKNFELVGHSYFKGPWLTQFAKDNGLGASFNTPRVYRNGNRRIGYFGGYNGPPILFGALIADVTDPEDMRFLSFVACQAGTRCPYIRVNNDKKILIGTHDTNASNPTPAPAGGAFAGVSFTDVSDPANPKPLGFFVTARGGSTHGMEIDDRYAYICASMPETAHQNVQGLRRSQNQEVVIVDYINPTNPVLAGRFHIKGNHVGETRDFMDDRNVDGSFQVNQCHEIHVHGDRLYVAYRDAGALVVDITNRATPTIISRLDYVPPFHGGGLGAAHSYMPLAQMDDHMPAKLAVLTDEIFSCPPGFGRVVDITTLQNPLFISNYRMPHIDDNYDREAGEFVCPPESQESIHHPWLDFRTTGLVYQAWYNQGLRAWDFSNPFLPREIGYYVSPNYQAPGEVGRHTREAYQDPDTGLIWVTDGNGGGITVLRWKGPLPPAPLPGAR